MKFLILLVLSFYSVTTFASGQELHARYLKLKTQLSGTVKKNVPAMLPLLTKLYQDTIRERDAMKKQLDSELALYKKTFSWMERHNPSHAPSSECKKNKIDPKEKEYNALVKVEKEVSLLIDEAKIKAGLMKPRNESSSDLDFNNSIGPTMGAAAGSSGS